MVMKVDHGTKVAPRALGTHWARKPPGGGSRSTLLRVDLMVPYSNHLDDLKTVHTTLASTDPAGVIADEPDLGTRP
jgi:hypothetical protein